MAAPETTLRPTRERPTPRRRAARRSLVSRLSAGHVLMVVAGLLAALLNFQVLRSGDDSVRIVVAATDLAPGTVLGTSDLRLADVPGDTALADALVPEAEFDLLDGSVVANHLEAGDPLRPSDLRDAVTQDGRLAMSIPVDPAHAVGGTLRPGDRVDLIEVTDAAARYLARDVEVLATADQGGTGALGGIATYHLTVAVDPDTALELAAAIRADSIEVVRATGAGGGR